MPGADRDPVSGESKRVGLAHDDWASYLSKPWSGHMLRGVPEDQALAIESDPVCGMQVDTETTDLKYEHDGTTYWFCSRGCMLDFRDDPAKYLDPDYKASM